MDQIRIVELTDKPWENRWQSLVEIFQGGGFPALQTQILSCTKSDFESRVKEVLSGDAHICFVGQSFSQEILKHIPQTTYEAIQLGATDVLVHEKDGWWPRPCLDEAFSRSLSKFVGQVDFDSQALIAGTDGWAMMVVSALAKMGFSHINIADSSDDTGQFMVSEMKKKYFHIEFKFIPFQSITTLPGVHSLFLNCIPLTLENEVLDELYFFNFLKAQGVVMDLNLIPSNTPLIVEAEQWGARHMSGEIIFAERDVLALGRVCHKNLPLEAYLSKFKAAVDAVPFDTSSILKRFRERGS